MSPPFLEQANIRCTNSTSSVLLHIGTMLPIDPCHCVALRALSNHVYGKLNTTEDCMNRGNVSHAALFNGVKSLSKWSDASCLHKRCAAQIHREMRYVGARNIAKFNSRTTVSSIRVGYSLSPLRWPRPRICCRFADRVFDHRRTWRCQHARNISAST